MTDPVGISHPGAGSVDDVFVLRRSTKLDAAART